MMELVVNGVPFTNFLNLSVGFSMDSFGRVFSFEATQDNFALFPFKVGDSCVVSLSGVPVVTGSIEVIQPSIESSDHRISIQGRSRACDLVDSSINGIQLNGERISLVYIIQQVLDFLGLDLKIENEVGSLQEFGKSDIVSSKPGQNAFDFIEQYARKAEVILLDDGYGDIVITRASDNLDPVSFRLVDGDELGNDILSSSIAIDYTDRFHKYIVIAQQNPTGLNASGVVDLKAVTKSEGEAFDDEVRSSRVLVIVAENASSKDQCIERAKWEANIRKARSVVYSATFQSHFMEDGEAFNYNRLHQVVDQAADISSELLINEVEFLQGGEGVGTTTKVTMVDQLAYTTIIDLPPATKRASEFGKAFQKSQEES